MKRSQHLTPLSHDHHQGLVFAKLLQEKLEKNADPDELRTHAVNFTEQHLEPHFELEESHLLSPLRRHRAQRLAWQLQKEHEQITRLVDQLRTPHRTMRTTLSVFAGVLKHHIRFEEREVFPFLEKHVDDEELEHLARQLKEAHADTGDETNIPLAFADQ